VSHCLRSAQRKNPANVDKEAEADVFVKRAKENSSKGRKRNSWAGGKKTASGSVKGGARRPGVGE